MIIKQDFSDSVNQKSHFTAEGFFLLVVDLPDVTINISDELTGDLHGGLDLETENSPGDLSKKSKNVLPSPMYLDWAYNPGIVSLPEPSDLPTPAVLLRRT
jgi:hypothetical protein